jgi:hypothetical protein
MSAQSPKDAEKLKEAKERVYLKGFYEGIMKVTTHKQQTRAQSKEGGGGEQIPNKGE